MCTVLACAMRLPDWAEKRNTENKYCGFNPKKVSSEIGAIYVKGDLNLFFSNYCHMSVINHK